MSLYFHFLFTKIKLSETFRISGVSLSLKSVTPASGEFSSHGEEIPRKSYIFNDFFFAFLMAAHCKRYGAIKLRFCELDAP